MVHRHLEPGNVMLGDFGEVYVLDRGLVWDTSSGERDVEREGAAGVGAGGRGGGGAVGGR